MMDRVQVVAADDAQFKLFKSLVDASEPGNKLTRIRNFNWRGTKVSRVIILPGGWDSLNRTEDEATSLRAYCARHNTQLFNVTQTKLNAFKAAVEAEKKNANS